MTISCGNVALEKIRSNNVRSLDTGVMFILLVPLSGDRTEVRVESSEFSVRANF